MMVVADPNQTDANRAAGVTDSLGWHVHYEVGGRLRVQLACGRQNAIDIARGLARQKFEVLRLVRYDGMEIIGADRIKELCEDRKPVRI